MKIVLVNASIRKTLSYGVEDGFPAGLEEVIGRYQPLGICYIASILRKYGYDDVKLIDADVNPNLEKIISHILQEDADIVGISALTFSFLHGLRLAKRLQKMTNALIVIGGTHLDLYPEETLTHTCFDLGVVGEGEYTFLKVVKHFEESGCVRKDFFKKIGKVDGVVFRRSGKVVRTKHPPIIKDIDRLPFPSRDLLNLNDYYHTCLPNPFVSILTSRGCPYRCSFCCRTWWNRTWRAHTPQRVVDEMESCIDMFGVSSFQFFDDTFTLSKRRTLKICRLIKARKLDVQIVCLTRIDKVDIQLLHELKSAGVGWISFGIESGDPKILKKMNKGITTAQIKKTLSACRRVGIESVCYFMIGHPDETERSIKNTIRLIHEARPEWFKANILTPYPGSQLYESLVRQGVIEDFWKKMTLEGRPYKPPHICQHLSHEELKRWVARINLMPYARIRSNLFNLHKIKSIRDLVTNLTWVKHCIINRLVW